VIDPTLLRLLVVVGALAAVAAAGWWWNRRSGTVRAPEGDGRFAREELAAVGLNGAAGVRAVLFGSPSCVPCRTVKEVLAEVEEERDGFTWVSIDAADHLELTRQHHILRVPTLFVIGHDGRIVARTSGVPATRDLVRVLDRTAEAG
jgi:thiol-disulfide isomerase/thioredoxin